LRENDRVKSSGSKVTVSNHFIVDLLTNDLQNKPITTLFAKEILEKQFIISSIIRDSSIMLESRFSMMHAAKKKLAKVQFSTIEELYDKFKSDPAV
jgi:hypothetical protein